MICPKCQNQMRTLDRLGVHIDQCESCRGIFLDRGELEQIAAAEQQHYSAAPPAYQPEPYAVHGSRPDSPPPFRQEHHQRYPDSPKPYGGHYGDSPRPYGHKRKRGGFLENLFD